MKKPFSFASPAPSLSSAAGRTRSGSRAGADSGLDLGDLADMLGINASEMTDTVLKEISQIRVIEHDTASVVDGQLALPTDSVLGAVARDLPYILNTGSPVSRLAAMKRLFEQVKKVKSWRRAWNLDALPSAETSVILMTVSTSVSGNPIGDPAAYNAAVRRGITNLPPVIASVLDSLV